MKLVLSILVILVGMHCLRAVSADELNDLKFFYTPIERGGLDNPDTKVVNNVVLPPKVRVRKQTKKVYQLKGFILSHKSCQQRFFVETEQTVLQASYETPDCRVELLKHYNNHLTDNQWIKKHGR